MNNLNEVKEVTQETTIVICENFDEEICGRREQPEYLPCAICTKHYGGCPSQRKVTLTATLKW